MPTAVFTDDVPLGFAEVSNRIGAGVSKHARTFFDSAPGDELIWWLVFDDKLNIRVVKLVLQHLEALRAESTTVLGAPPAWHEALSSAVVGDSMPEEAYLLPFLLPEFDSLLEERVRLQEGWGRPEVFAFVLVYPHMIARTEVVSELSGIISMFFERKVLVSSSSLQVYGDSLLGKRTLQPIRSPRYSV
jgi:hypothetical protein